MAQPHAKTARHSLDEREGYPHCDLARGYRYPHNAETPWALKRELVIEPPYTNYDNWTCEVCKEAGHDMHDLCCRKDPKHLSPLLRILHPQCVDLGWPYIHHVCTPQHGEGVGNNERKVWVERGFLCPDPDGNLHLREADAFYAQTGKAISRNEEPFVPEAGEAVLFLIPRLLIATLYTSQVPVTNDLLELRPVDGFTINEIKLPAYPNGSRPKSAFHLVNPLGDGGRGLARGFLGVHGEVMYRQSATGSCGVAQSGNSHSDRKELLFSKIDGISLAHGLFASPVLHDMPVAEVRRKFPNHFSHIKPDLQLTKSNTTDYQMLRYLSSEVKYTDQSEEENVEDVLQLEEGGDYHPHVDRDSSGIVVVWNLGKTRIYIFCNQIYCLRYYVNGKCPATGNSLTENHDKERSWRTHAPCKHCIIVRVASGDAVLFFGGAEAGCVHGIARTLDVIEQVDEADLPEWAKDSAISIQTRSLLAEILARRVSG